MEFPPKLQSRAPGYARLFRAQFGEAHDQLPRHPSPEEWRARAKSESFVYWSRVPWRPRGVALKENGEITLRSFRPWPPSSAYFASWSDISRSNQAAPFRSR